LEIFDQFSYTMDTCKLVGVTFGWSFIYF